MSSPVIWIVFPLIVSIVLIFFNRQRLLTVILAISTTLLLAVLAWQLEIGEVIIVGSWVFKIDDLLPVMGRGLLITNADRPKLVLFFMVAAFWFFGALVVDVPRLFVPLGLGTITVLMAALTVEPFIYAALLIEIAVLASVLMLTPLGGKVGPGVLRFLTYQTLGMLFILLAGWFLTGVDTGTENIKAVVQVATFLGFGFAFLLGIFPLHSWIPMLSKESHPYVVSFVFATLLSVGTLFGLNFINRYPWLQETLNTLDILRFLGVMMIIAGGAWAAFQRHLGSMLGYALIVEIGRTLIVISLPSGQMLSYALLLPRFLSLGVWALALTVLWEHSNKFHFSSVQGMARKFPIAGAGVILAHFSLAGFPLLAGFPIYLTLWEQLSNAASFAAFWSILGSVGLMAGGLRSLAVLVMGPEDLPWPEEERESIFARILILVGIVMLFVMGLFPQWFLTMLTSLSMGVETLTP
ncbi:MAG: proton-conducting transporter membrane subunit [Chloroflexota bacterium]|nr:proton-conducting transporter membrane subunit [Chloroflexota bacterium]